MQNLNHILELNVYNTYKPFLLLLYILQLYHVYFCYYPSPIASFKLLGQLNRLYIDSRAYLALLLYIYHLLLIRTQLIYILFNSYKLLQTPRPIRYLDKIAIIGRNSIRASERPEQIGQRFVYAQYYNQVVLQQSA